MVRSLVARHFWDKILTLNCKKCCGVCWFCICQCLSVSSQTWYFLRHVKYWRSSAANNLPGDTIPSQFSVSNYYCYSRFTALCPGLTGWAGTRRNIHPPTYPDHQPSFISFFHLLWSITSSLFNVCDWQSFCTTSVQVLFGLPLGLEPSTSYLMHFFTQPVSSFATRAHTCGVLMVRVASWCHYAANSAADRG